MGGCEYGCGLRFWVESGRVGSVWDLRFLLVLGGYGKLWSGLVWA